MENSIFYKGLIDKFKKIVKEKDLLNEKIKITGKALEAEEAIGNPSRKDYPILKGKEKLMQADFKGEKGQAFTDMPGSFSGTIEEILENPLDNNFNRAAFISTLNAVLKYLNITNKTIHCKDDEPEECSEKLIDYIKDNYDSNKVALIGLQPAMLEKLSEHFDVRVVDLDDDNIGKLKFGVEIEDGMKKTNDLIEWCDIIIATGSTIVNGSIVNFITEKPTIFFGTTVAGAASLMNLNRFCECGA